MTHRLEGGLGRGGRRGGERRRRQRRGSGEQRRERGTGAGLNQLTCSANAKDDAGAILEDESNALR